MRFPHTRRGAFGLACCLALFLLAACAYTQSPFARMASSTGSGFAAASYTLALLHHDHLTAAYVRSSFVNFQSELQGVDQQLPSQQGAPDSQTIQRLLALYRPAMQAVNAPCIDPTCDWGSQIAQLDRASRAFLEAAGT
ncbi:MAG TPA: hypothetical protein VF510_20760 [Ktedonobacterales bacterium]